jgi:hypothetical protein
MQSPNPPPSSHGIDWSAHLAALAQSGQSVLAYARAHGLAADTLYRKRARARKQPARSPRLLPVTVEASTLCELVFPDGRVLRFPASIAPDTLRAFVLVVAAR